VCQAHVDDIAKYRGEPRREKAYNPVSGKAGWVCETLAGSTHEHAGEEYARCNERVEEYCIDAVALQDPNCQSREPERKPNQPEPKPA
jgi:hypothetical protein